MALVNEILLIDGENLTLRYQDMVQSGWSPVHGIRHKMDAYVWSGKVWQFLGKGGDLMRMSYYTSCVGDEEFIEEIRQDISDITVNKPGNYYDVVKMRPEVFKRLKVRQSVSICDVSLVIDAMRLAYNDAVNILTIISGDGDFIDLYRELGTKGVKVCVGALTSGCNKKIKHVVDSFSYLDKYFFEGIEIGKWKIKGGNAIATLKPKSYDKEEPIIHIDVYGSSGHKKTTVKSTGADEFAMKMGEQFGGADPAEMIARIKSLIY